MNLKSLGAHLFVCLFGMYNQIQAKKGPFGDKQKSKGFIGKI